MRVFVMKYLLLLSKRNAGDIAVILLGQDPVAVDYKDAAEV